MSIHRVAYPPLDVAPACLVQWLHNYTRWIHPLPKFAARGAGHHCLRWAQPSDLDIGDSPIVLEMELVHIVDGHELPNHDGPRSRAIRLTIVPFPPAQTELVAECSYGPAESYFHALLEAIQRRWKVSPERRETIAFGTPVENSTDEAEQQDTPLVEEELDSVPEVEKIIVPLDRRDVHSHLRALCTNDPRFSLWGSIRTDADLEKLTVYGSRTITQKEQPAPPTIIGTVQLLVSGSNTLVMFVAKDLRFRHKIPDEGKTGFREFIKVVHKHFDEIIPHQSPAPTERRARVKRGKNIDTALKVAKARLILEKLNRMGRGSQKLACDLAETTPYTFRRWRDDPDILEQMDELRQDSAFLKELESI